LGVSFSQETPLEIRIADSLIALVPLLPLSLGMKLALADVDGEGLQETVREVSSIVGASNVLATPIDVANLDEVVKFKERVFEAWDEV
jgi:hypothetical protein